MVAWHFMVALMLNVFISIYIYSFYSFLCFLHVMLNICFFFDFFFLHYFFFLAAPCATCIQYGLLLYAWKNKTKTRRLLLPLYLWVFFNICLFLFKHFISFLKYKNLKLRLRKNIQTNKKQKKTEILLKETKSATTSLCVITFFLANHWYFIRHHRFTYLSIWNHQSFNANIFCLLFL